MLPFQFPSLRFIFFLSSVTQFATGNSWPEVGTRSLLDERASLSTTPSNRAKAGLAWPNGDQINPAQYATTGKVSWYYTWSAYPIKSTLEFVPMLWGNRTVGEFESTINDTLAKFNVTAVLGFNEPQQTGQSNLTVEEGVQLWKTHMEPLKQRGLRLGSPAPSSAPSGKIWMQQFFAACNNTCTVDFVALHWYDINATAFKSYITDFYQTFSRPIWVTEWACQNYNNPQAQCSLEATAQFLNETQSWMDNTSFVERYAWFGAMPDLHGVNPACALMDPKGSITDLGREYIGERNSTTGGGNSSTGSGSGAAQLRLSSAFAVVLTLLGVLQTW